MKSIETKWTKTGITAREIVTQVSGPGHFKSDLAVPKGTRVRFIGHWVVAELGWLAKSEGEAICARMDYPASQINTVGRNSITYHDADHYGITIDAADVVNIKDVV